MNSRNGFSRRLFLGGLGISAAASPFIPLLNASALEATAPKRLLLFYTPHGTIYNQWVPTGTETSFTLGALLKPLEKHQSKITVIANMSMPDKGVGAAHTKGLPLLWSGSGLQDSGVFKRNDCAGGCTYGWNSSATVDQLIVKALKPATTYPSLEFGVRCGANHPQTRMIYSDIAQPLSPQTDPWAAFSRIFGGALPTSPTDPSRAERQSSIDVVKAELDALRTRATAADLVKLDAHLTSIRALETRLNSAHVSCAAPKLGGSVASETIANIPAVVNGHFDLITAALACDLTRIASFQYGVGDNDNNPYPWLDITDGHHPMTHASDSDTATWAKVAKIRIWYATKFSELLDRLDAVPEGNGTLLDNTLVVWGSELGKGNTHSYAQTPFVVAGGGGGAVKVGRFLQVSPGTTHSRLLVSICHAMGMPSTMQVGNLDPGSGPLASLMA